MYYMWVILLCVCLLRLFMYYYIYVSHINVYDSADAVYAAFL